MLKVVQQSVDGHKKIRRLNIIEVPVVPLAALVVIAHPALTTCAKVQPLLVKVSARMQWLRNPPNNNFNNRALVSYLLGFGDQRLSHLYCISAMHCNYAIYLCKIYKISMQFFPGECAAHPRLAWI